MTSVRGVLIGIFVMILGFAVVGTFLSPSWLFSIGVDVKTYNFISQQFKIWGLVIGLAIVIAGLVVMGKVD